MARSQMKRLSSPKTWPITRKGSPRWVAKPFPGTHKLDQCISIVTVLKEILALANTSREVKQVLKSNDILINARKVKDLKEGLGLFDVLSIGTLGKYYRMIFTEKGKLALAPIKKEEANILPLKVKSRSLLKKGKVQTNFTNGWNLLGKEKRVISSTVLFDLSKKQPGKGIEMKAGAMVTLIGGKHIGQVAKIVEIKEEGALKKKKIAMLKSAEGEFSTAAEYLFVIGEGAPEFTVTANGTD